MINKIKNNLVNVVFVMLMVGMLAGPVAGQIGMMDCQGTGSVCSG